MLQYAANNSLYNVALKIGPLRARQVKSHYVGYDIYSDVTGNDVDTT